MRRRILFLVVGMTTLVVLAFAVPLGLLIPSVVTRNGESAVVDQANRSAAYLRGKSPSAAAIQSVVDAQADDKDHHTWIVAPNKVYGSQPAGSDATNVGSYGRTPQYGRPGGEGDGPGGPTAQLTDAYGGRVARAVVGDPNSSDTYIVSVWVSNGALRDGQYGWWVLLVAGSLLLLVAGAAAGEVLTRRIVGPLERSAQTAHRISAGDLTARAPTDGAPEVAEVGVALNQLADRIDELVAEERETVADLSHRMRTPLTALRLDAEALADPEDAERIGGHVSALERTLTAVIRAARRPQREGRAPAADATAVVGERLRFWSALTDEQDRRASIRLAAAPVYVRCAAEDLAAAVDALVENVVAHTPEGTAFAVLLRATDDGALLEVSDEGPGLPDGVGVRGRSDRGSSGLGLSIARQCAEASGGSMATGRAPGGGALVALHLGAAQVAPGPAQVAPTEP